MNDKLIGPGIILMAVGFATIFITGLSCCGSEERKNHPLIIIACLVIGITMVVFSGFNLFWAGIGRVPHESKESSCLEVDEDYQCLGNISIEDKKEGEWFLNVLSLRTGGLRTCFTKEKLPQGHFRKTKEGYLPLSSQPLPSSTAQE